MDYKDKYIKYKSKYMYLKNLSGGEKVIGNISKVDIQKLLNSNIQLVNGHGTIDLTQWYVVPENTYIITTTQMGSVTHIDNKIFYELLNDDNNRTELGKILEQKLMGKHKKESAISHTYDHFYEILEPGDIIPKIVISLHHANGEDSAIDYYANLNLPKYSKGDYTKYDYMNIIKRLVRNHEHFKITGTGITHESELDKNVLVKLAKAVYNKYKSNLKPYDTNTYQLEHMLEENGLDIDKYMFNINNWRERKFDELFESRNQYIKLPFIDDIKFVNMLITLLLKEDDIYKINYNIKEIIESMPKPDASNPRLVVLTSCLHTKHIFRRIYQKQINSMRKYFNTNKHFFNKDQFSEYQLSKLCTDQLSKDDKIADKISILGNFINSRDFLDTRHITYFDFFPTNNPEIIQNEELKNNVKKLITISNGLANATKIQILNDSYEFNDVNIEKIKKIHNEGTFGIVLTIQEVNKLLVRSFEESNIELLKLIFDIFVPHSANFSFIETRIVYKNKRHESEIIQEYLKLKSNYVKVKEFASLIKKDSIANLNNIAPRPSSGTGDASGESGVSGVNSKDSDSKIEEELRNKEKSEEEKQEQAEKDRLEKKRQEEERLEKEKQKKAEEEKLEKEKSEQDEIDRLEKEKMKQAKKENQAKFEEFLKTNRGMIKDYDLEFKYDDRLKANVNLDNLIEYIKGTYNLLKRDFKSNKFDMSEFINLYINIYNIIATFETNLLSKIKLELYRHKDGDYRKNATCVDDVCYLGFDEEEEEFVKENKKVITDDKNYVLEEFPGLNYNFAIFFGDTNIGVRVRYLFNTKYSKLLTRIIDKIRTTDEDADARIIEYFRTAPENIKSQIGLFKYR